MNRDDLVAEVRAERERQGLSPQLTDAEGVSAVAAVLLSTSTGRRALRRPRTRTRERERASA